MKVKELIKLLQECDQEKEVKIDGKNIYSVEELFFVENCVEIYADEEEEEESQDYTEFFERLVNGCELLDSLKINGVR